MKRLTIEVDDKTAATLLELVVSLPLANLHMETVQDTEGPAPRKKRAFKSRGGDNAIKSILRLMKGKPVGTELSINTCRLALEEAGLNKSGASGATSRMTKDGLLEISGRGLHRITHKGEAEASKVS